jgi:hypothetical protein
MISNCCLSAPNNGWLCCAFDMHPLPYAQPHILSSAMPVGAVHSTSHTRVHSLVSTMFLFCLAFVALTAARSPIPVRTRCSIDRVRHQLIPTLSASDRQPKPANAAPVRYALNTRAWYSFLLAMLMRLSPSTMPASSNPDQQHSAPPSDNVTAVYWRDTL